MTIAFEFIGLEEARKIASLFRKQAAAFRLLANRLTGEEAQKFGKQARHAIAIASRIDATADRRSSPKGVGSAAG